MPKSNQSSVKFGYWNIGGLFSKGMNKAEDPLFLKHIENYDIVFLVETHVGYNSQIHNIGKFHYHPICRKLSNNNRHFGGIAILQKSHVKPHVKILINSNPDYQWIKLEKSFFGFKSDLFICVLYNPPVTSKYTQELSSDVFDCIEKDILQYKKMGEILLCGDFNARIGSENDFIVNDDSKFTPIFDTYPTDKNIMTRKSRDQKIDQRGKEVLDFCISKQIRILNGRVLGDTFGNFTCYTPNGASVVDYVAVSEEILENVLYFKVSRFIPTLSDCHCKLEWELSAKYCVPGENDIPIQLKNMTPNYIWTDCSAIKFQETLSSDTLQNYILEFNNSTIQFTQTSVDEASSKLSNIFLSAANLSLKRPLKKHTNKQKNKKWFDASLQQARTNLLNYGKIYSRFPYDPIIKNHFYKLNREYSKLRKYKYKQYKQSLISQLDSLHEENPKLYWNLINELQEKNETKKNVEYNHQL
ncbi:unnamed protein product [Mytilus edulis]|uniref:Endonuclease/exonuclease/phosphatase domain-containing protein n=2 Tax=Mytilus TaxID=6548 RepID=A0A8S3PTN9_MYTED|nr:unnamed protein product [Mytilus edulis]